MKKNKGKRYDNAVNALLAVILLGIAAIVCLGGGETTPSVSASPSQSPVIGSLTQGVSAVRERADGICKQGYIARMEIKRAVREAPKGPSARRRGLYLDIPLKGRLEQ